MIRAEDLLLHTVRIGQDTWITVTHLPSGKFVKGKGVYLLERDRMIKELEQVLADG